MGRLINQSDFAADPLETATLSKDVSNEFPFPFFRSSWSLALGTGVPTEQTITHNTICKHVHPPLVY